MKEQREPTTTYVYNTYWLLPQVPATTAEIIIVLYRTLLRHEVPWFNLSEEDMTWFPRKCAKLHG
jgi:hypothetical protein